MISRTVGKQVAGLWRHQAKQIITTQKMIDNDPELQKQVKENQEKFNLYFNQQHSEQKKYLEEQMSDESRLKVKFIVDTIMKMQEKEKQLFRFLVSGKMSRVYGVDMNSLRGDLPLLKEQEGPNPFTHQKQQQQADTLHDQLGRTFSQIFPGLNVGGGGQVEQVEQVSIQEQQEKQEEVKVKTNWDVELTAIDPANKIKVIKEVRSLCSLGLKEAKDLVDKLPGVLAKQAITQDAQALQEKLQALGCTIILK